MKKLIFFLILVVTGVNSIAQDYHFSQYLSNPVFLNPGFSGSDSCPRFVVNTRLQWPELAAEYKTISASYDQYVPKLKGGLAVSYVFDVAGNTIYSNNLNFSYSYKLKLGNDMHISPAISVGMVAKSLDESKINMSPDYNPRYNFNSGAGFLFSYKYLALGYSADHLNTPNESFFTNVSSKLPVKHIAFLSALIDLGSNVNLNPSIMFESQNKFEELVPAISLMIKGVKIGAAYRTGFENPDAVIGLIGYQNARFFAGYSYDYTVSKLSNASGGAHELALIYKLKKSSLAK